MTSETTLRRAAIVLSILGLAVALYLVYFKFNPTTALCLSAGGCEVVNTSSYSEIKGIPIAIFGALAYAAMLASVLLETRGGLFEEYGTLFQFGVALAGTLYSAYLTYIEIAVLHNICPYCATSAVIITLLLVVFSIRLRKTF